MPKQPPKAPWKTPKPKGSGGQKLTPEEIEMARDRAAKAGRRYPNLVDNMAVLKLRKAMDVLP
jgi:hypothetical protein